MIVFGVILGYSIDPAMTLRCVLRQRRDQHLRHGRAVQRRAPADAGVHPHVVPALVLVDVDDLAVLVGREVHGVPGRRVQLRAARARRCAARPARRARGTPSRTARCPAGSAGSRCAARTGATRASAATAARSTCARSPARPAGRASSARWPARRAAPARGPGSDSSDALRRRRAVAPTRPRSRRAGSATSGAGSGGPTSWWVRSADAARRCPARSRRRGDQPASVAARKPAANASPAPTGSTTSTRSAGWNTDRVAVDQGRAVRAPCLTTSVAGSGRNARISAGVADAPHGLRLVGADEHDVGGRGELAQHRRRPGRPTAGAASSGRTTARCAPRRGDERRHQREAAVRQRGRDPAGVHDPDAVEGRAGPAGPGPCPRRRSRVR